MKAAQFFQHPQEPVPSSNSGTVCPAGELEPSRRTLAAAWLIVAVCMSVASCASTTAPYNPNHLNADQLSQVGEVCQTIVGFHPSETLTDSLWPGNPDPAVRNQPLSGVCRDPLDFSEARGRLTCSEASRARLASRRASRQAVPI